MSMPKKYCDNCNVTHSTIMCYQKPRKTIQTKKDLTWDQTVSKWHLANPGPHECYLQIASLCVTKLDTATLTLDHVVPKSRGSKFKYDLNNLRPACRYCNSLKGSRTLESLAREYPRLNQYL